MIATLSTAVVCSMNSVPSQSLYHGFSTVITKSTLDEPFQILYNVLCSGHESNAYKRVISLVVIDIYLHLLCCRDKFSKAQKRKSGILKSAASVMNELQRNIDGWEVSTRQTDRHITLLMTVLILIVVFLLG